MLNRLTKLGGLTRTWIAILVPAIFSWLFTIAAIFWFADYGTALFVLIPIFIGACTTVLYCYGVQHSKKSIASTVAISIIIYSVGLILFAIEGLICIAMAAPLAILISLIGVAIGHSILKHSKGSPLPSVIVLGLLIPLTMSFESLTKSEPEIYSVTTSVIIDATKEQVWDKVVAFSHIDEPEELLFKAGVAYPTHAEIKGNGVGAIRYCNFSTGRFVEPITTWNQPDLLEFSVKEMPEPLTEISPYDIHPTHLHGYFVSTNGRFKLTKTADNKTLLEGTTWYYHKIAPAFYWQIWTKYILHKIHNRVLNHIKKDAEQ